MKTVTDSPVPDEAPMQIPDAAVEAFRWAERAAVGRRQDAKSAIRTGLAAASVVLRRQWEQERAKQFWVRTDEVSD